jgi:phosphatidate cytidylyltransferase
MMGFMSLDPAVRWSIAGIFGLLVVASLVLKLLIRVKPDTDWTEMSQRIRSWWIMAVVFSTAMALARLPQLLT